MFLPQDRVLEIDRINNIVARGLFIDSTEGKQRKLYDLVETALNPEIISILQV